MTGILPHARLGFLIGAVLLLASFLVLLVRPVSGVPPLSFTLDDAYITYRYAENLANGHGPVWNPGSDDPVEGYSSFLWMMMSAASAKLGVDPETASKIVSVSSALAVMLILAFAFEAASGAARLVAVSGLALSPAFVLLSAQGMETAFASLLAVVICLFFLQCLRERKPAALFGYHLSGLLAVATRPDLSVFWLVLTVALFLRLYLDGQRAGLKRAAVALGLAAVLPGLIYFLWRWSYYGHFLPNTFYVKSPTGGLGSSGLDNTLTFLLRVAGPYVLLALFLQSIRWPRLQGQDRYASSSILLAVFAFLVAVSFFEPIQGFLWRYQMPVFPALLLLLVLVSRRVSSPRDGATRPPLDARLAYFLLLALLLLYPLNTAGDVATEMRKRWQYDRVAVGKALAEFADGRPLMLVSEAGALPRFSRWRAIDLLGLTDERIAHRGASSDYFEEVEPTVVAIKEVVVLSPQGRYGSLYEFMRRHNYAFAAATRKTNPQGMITNAEAHLYFVRVSDPRAAEIVETLRGVDRVVYVGAPEMGRFLRGTGVPIARIDPATRP